MNPFDAKFKQFAEKLTSKNSQGHAEQVAAKSGDLYADKPFTSEFQTIYKVTQWGQTLAQVVTYATTAGLGVFALQHVIPSGWGIYVAVPLALLFAYGVESVKRSTLAIASKHLLKYKTFGFVGIVAALVMCVSIAAALYGAKEMPGVFYPLPARSVDATAAAQLTADIDRVQKDIDRTTSTLASEKNWVAENRTLPRLQKERAALVNKRDAAQKEAGGRGDTDHAEALALRADNVAKMQTYTIGAAIVAELVFLFCTGFIFYYLFRAFAEQEQDAPQPDETPAPTENKATGAGNGLSNPIGQRINGQPINTANGVGIDNETRPPIGFAYANRNAPARTENVETQTVHTNQRLCEHCQTPYIYGHARQRYCTEVCRVAAWEGRTGKTLKKQRAAN